MIDRLSMVGVVLAGTFWMAADVSGQCPGPNPGTTPSGPSGGAGLPAPAGSSALRANAALATSGATGSTGRGRSTTAPTTGTGAGGRGRATRSTFVPTTSGASAGWWEWWEMNRLQYIRPHALAEGESNANTRYAANGRLDEGYAAKMRARVLPLIEKATHDSDARVRARAAMTWGRLGGRDALPRLTEMMDDRVQHVRHCAMLGLGATGDIAAAQSLLAIANDPKRARQISSHGTSIALMSLAIGRHYGFPTLVERYVEDILDTVDMRDDDQLAAAAFVYDSLAPSRPVQRHAMNVAANEGFEVIARCNALMSLGKGSDGTVTPTLLEALDDTDVDVRRAAAMALSRQGDRPVLDHLVEALEEENDAIARGFLVIAIGEQDDERVFDVLSEQISRSDDQALRPWTAIALGIYARRTGDEAACEAIHTALDDEANHDSHGAYLVACGIARDEGSVESLSEILKSAGDARQRTFAAQSLALIGGERSRAALVEQLDEETWPYARAAIAQSLGHLGHREDGARVVEMVRTLKVPELQASIASAASFHGSATALEGLIEVLLDRRAADEARGAALDGIGLLLGESRGLLMADLAANANYRSFPSWVATLMGDVTL